jgi:hypothetical protein
MKSAFAACFLAVLSLSVPVPVARAEDRAERVRRDLADVTSGGRWIYNDLPKGFEEAKSTGKPLLVVLRCIPCESCRGFDEGVASFDRRVDALLDRFVRVRVPMANGLDLSLFQPDYDLSFFAFFLNADRTIYGRFGTRSTQEDKSGEVSIEAFREAMQKALDLHARHAEVKESLGKKTGAPPPFKVPEEAPDLKGKYKAELDYEGKVVQSCIHCHQVRESERLIFRSRKEPIPDSVLFPWPSPDVLGLQLDPRRAVVVKKVEPGSAGEKAEFRDGDEIISLEGHPLVSAADVAWILHGSPETGTLDATVRRGGSESKLKIALEKGWRRRTDISWRASTWDLRRMATGGLLLKDVTADERKAHGIPPEKLALLVKHAGEYGEHATARNAGVRNGDIIVALEGRRDPLREEDLIAHGVQEKRPGDEIELTVLRKGQEKTVRFKLR